MLKALAAGQLLPALSAGATNALPVVLPQERLQAGASFGLLVAAIPSELGSGRGCCC